MRLLIPDPCLWDTESPFLYKGKLELWEDDQRCAEVRLSHGLRSIKLGSRGLRVNDRPFRIQGIRLPDSRTDELPGLHRSGFNTLLTPFNDRTAGLCAAANRLGFLVVATGIGPADDIESVSAVAAHASFLGWLPTAEAMSDQSFRTRLLQSFRPSEKARLGIEIVQPLSEPFPDDVHFVYSDESLLKTIGNMERPKILRMTEPPPNDPSSVIMSSPGILGWIWDSSATIVNGSPQGKGEQL
jgi:hypothetical protein